jgi:ribose/xylose/arabinose/galactoside ABC-type transport system permease subunit
MRSSDSLAMQAYRAVDKLGPLVALIGVWALFAAQRWGTFATWENTQNILLQTVVVGIAALGGTMIIISGGIDLSVGSLIALVAVSVALLINKMVAWEWSHGQAALAASSTGILLGALCGLAIGTMVIGRIGRVAAPLALGLGGLLAWGYGMGTPRGVAALALGGVAAVGILWADRRIKPPLVLTPFIVTLGMWGALRGTAKGLADNAAVYMPTDFDTRLFAFMRMPTAKASASLVARPWEWWSPGVWIFLVLAALIAALLRYTQFGRHIYAIGSNEQTSRLCGVHVERAKLKIYTIAGLLAGVAGVLQFGFNKLGDPTTAGGYELKVIAAAVIGGASLSGGMGSVLGTVAGALMMTIIDNGCTKLGLEVWIQEILTGGIIVTAVALDQLRRRAAT